MSDKTEKLVVLMTRGIDSELSSVAFTIANGGLTAGLKVYAFLTRAAVDVVRKRGQAHTHVPPLHAAEMTPFDPLVGEFRVHYDGFFDPGFGHSGAGGTGSRAVLEVRSHEVPFILEHGQVVGRLVYERMLSRPKALYGTDLKSNYQAQGLKLSKHFR